MGRFARVSGLVWAPLLFGVAVEVLGGHTSGGWRIPGIVVDSHAGWCAAAYVAGLLAGGPVVAAIAGLLTEVGATLGYFVAGHLLGTPGITSSWGDIWQSSESLAVPALFAGPVFGIAGRLAVGASRWRFVCRLALPVVFMYDAWLNWGLGDPLVHSVAVAELAASAAALAWLVLSIARQVIGPRPGWSAR